MEFEVEVQRIDVVGRVRHRPEPKSQAPAGGGGELLHGWMRELAVWCTVAGLKGGVTNASTRLFTEDENLGAIIMGRNMFGGGPGPWRCPRWDGWWGGQTPVPPPGLCADPPPAPPH